MEKHVYTETYKLEKDYWWHVSKRSLVKQALKKTFGDKKNIHILDAGCGTGIMMSEMEQLYPNVYGLDKSPLAREFCQKRGLKNIHFGDLEKKLPFKTKSFDAITALDVIEHLDHDMLALEEFWRILKPGGKLFVTVPAYQFLWTNHDDLLWHKRRYRRNKLEKMVKALGFKVEKSSYFYSFLIPPAIFLFKFKLMFNSGNSKTSVVGPKPINWLLNLICALERKAMDYFSLPTGISIFLVASKP